MPRALIFSMQLHLVDFYQLCSNYAPGTKNGPALASYVLHRLIKEKREQIFWSETTGPRPLIFSM